MCRGRSLAIALDSEFLKGHGDVFVSAVAFVPFSSTRGAVAGSRTEKICDHGMLGIRAPHPLSKEMRALPHMTVFGKPIILNLSPLEVLRRADVFPCGHCLKPLLKEALVSGERLKDIQLHHARRTGETALRHIQAAGPDTRALFAGFDSICPHSIPNIRRANKVWLQALYDAQVGTVIFREASKQLNYLFAYGRGRRQERAMSFLLRHSPELLQDVLRASFPTSDAWCAWLSMCADAVEAELSRLAADLRCASSLPAPMAPLAARDADDCCNIDAEGGIQYKECKTMEELSCELNRVWASFLRAGGTKFYSYGDMDARAVQNTLRFSCVSPGVKKSLCPRGLGKQLPDAVPTPLSSPYEAKLVDVTRHPLFAAAGFCPSPRATPTLQRALEKAAAVDGAAARLHEQCDQHNPLWDAKALACVGVACGIGV